MSRHPISHTLAVLQSHGPQHSAKIAERVGYSQTSARRHLAELRSLGLAHITDWWRPAAGGGYSPVYVAGAGEDAPFRKQPRKRVKKARPVYVAKVHAVAKLKQVYRPGVFDPFATLIAQVA